MRLKRLELAGFKTFADKTTLEFAGRITGIVGPNGSGKSNIFDAIRWALGEGSVRAVRGVRSEDVIFAGSDRRRPLAMAEVALTLDNADGTLALPAEGDGEGPLPLAFAEVTVSRRALRGADSQYSINGVPCRLRDIQSLFLGTGLGGHSYALISQGEVDRMLDATPEERRMVFEEAAGVAKYKRRRREAERRIEAASQVLARVQDVLAEQEARVAQLALQAEAAEQYRAWTRELRSLELALQVEEIRRLERSRRRIHDQLDQLAARRREAEEALRAAEEEQAALEERRVAAGQEWEALQRSLVALTDRRAAAKARVQMLEDRARALAAERARLAEERERAAGEEAQLEAEQRDLAGALRDLEEERERVRRLEAEARAALQKVEDAMARDADQLEAARGDLRRLAVARAQAQEELARLRARLAASQDRVAALDREVQQLEGARAAAQERCRTLVEELSRLTAAMEAARSEVESLRSSAGRCREGLAAAEAALRRRELDREALRSRVAYLEDAHSQYRGYDAGTRRLLLMRRRDPEALRGLRCAVAEVLHVPQEMRPVVEAVLALGGASSAVVVGEAQDVTELAGLLEEGEGATFFVPSLAGDAGPRRDLPPGWERHPAVVGSLLDLVGVEAGYEAVATGLLGGVLVVADFAAAVGLRSAGYGGRIATLAGEVLASQGLVFIGHRTSNGGSPVGRADEIAEARGELERLEVAVREAAARVEEEMRRLREAEARAARAEQDLREAGDRRGDLERRLALAEAEASRLAEDLARARAQREAVGRDAEQHAQALAQAAAELDALEGQVSAAEEEVSRLEERLRGQTAGFRDAQERVTEARVSLTVTDGRWQALAGRAGEVEARLLHVRARRAEVTGELERREAEAEALAADLASAGAHAREVAGEAAQVEERLASLEAERDSLLARAAEAEAHRREAAGRLQAVSDDLHRVELRQAQADAEITGLRRRVEEESGQPFDRAVEGVPDGVDRVAAQGRIETLRQKITALGPVNLMAIDEHRAASARAAALRAQRDDVQGALDALRALIRDLEAVIQRRFDETYRAVGEEFADLFVRLFGGGKAGLVMVDVEGSDEPGVDIVVQPPGRALRSLQALSGGERVMVALALTFAMLRVRPSPFCVFDEVEAALDEANTRKIAELLRELADQSQVIIITHNKATMEACDVLFGVTTEEAGVSHLVSLRLQSREEQPVG